MKARQWGPLVSVVVAALAVSALLAPTALAATPKAGYERFAGCPSPEEFPEELLCLRAVIDGGHFQMGSKDVPISKPITLSGGASFETGAVVANSKGGMTPVKQLVPGGIIGLTGLDWLVNFLGIEELKLYAVTEIAGQPFIKGGGEIELPIRVHLENPVLGKNCYVGTFANPIKLKMTTGTTNPPAPNKPITGVEPTEGVSDLEEVFLLQNGVLVDNSFAAPGASGCVLTLFGFLPISINGLVNSQSGLPSPAGTNETKQNFDLELTPQEVVYP
jgi:hypothetical protein